MNTTPSTAASARNVKSKDVSKLRLSTRASLSILASLGELVVLFEGLGKTEELVELILETFLEGEKTSMLSAVLIGVLLVVLKPELSLRGVVIGEGAVSTTIGG
jgi:hypothetical protein